MHRRTHHRDAVDLCEEMVGSFETGQCVVSVFEGKIQLSGIASAAGRVTPGPGCTCIGSAEFGGSGEYRFEYSMQTCELRWSRAGARQMNVWRKDGECETGCSQDEVTTVAPHLTAESPLAQAAFAHQVAKETLSAAEAAEAVVEAAQAEGQSGPAVEKARQKMFSARKAIAVARSAEQRVAQLSAAYEQLSRKRAINGVAALVFRRVTILFCSLLPLQACAATTVLRARLIPQCRGYGLRAASQGPTCTIF
mmetsp:Transcript_47841/g.126755  ORF Transcript_47841/g.126755 Transcript_47841/m.126755 type:complete len:252 (-) Transcript_47841:404-1159(-)